MIATLDIDALGRWLDEADQPHEWEPTTASYCEEEFCSRCGLAREVHDGK